MKAKKSLGQNFLTSKNIVKTAVRAGKIKKGDVVLEIGPGKGILTQGLLNSGAKVIAFEKDSNLSSYLENKFSSAIKEGKLKVINDDIFNINKYKKLRKYKIVANIPYNITGKLLRLLFILTPRPRQIVLMVQYEVAKRIVAEDNKESILSISTKLYCEPLFIKKVPAKLFKPKPKVDSAIIRLNPIDKNRLSKSKEETFFKILKKGFSSKRKLLKNNLNIDESILENCGIDKKARAENVNLEGWLCLTNHIK